MFSRTRKTASILLISTAMLTACQKDGTPKAAPDATPAADSDPAATPAAVTPEDATAFVKEVDSKLRELWTNASRAEWNKSTNITDETEAAAAKANAAVMEYETKTIQAATKFDILLEKLDPATKRQLHLLKLTSTLPAPPDPKKRDELATIAARLEGLYGKGKYCRDVEGKEKCQDLGELSDVLAESRDYDELLDAWAGWRTISIPMRQDYQRLVELGNEGAKAIGVGNMADIWRARYDMTPDEFEKEVDRLWTQVSPLYEQLHCHVRAQLHEKYGDRVPETGAIPAHVLGNMWAQDWANLYPMLEPYPGEPSIDVTKALSKKGYDAVKMVKLGEQFFTSLGLNPLPATFWERSLLVKPDDRDVVCHASAWDVDYSNDLRIKMCIKVNHEDLVTIHHELGHNYYYNNYYKLPVLFQSGAHDGFHEAIGDAIALSITPGYLKEVGLLDKVSSNDRGIINKQMQDALAKIAFLPFGKLIDQWRWDVFSGKVTPDQYNAAWWKLREDVQGIKSPIVRNESQFDPGGKYHIPANVPYSRYFLAHILQFQFHKAMCEAAGHEGPLHTCSVYGSKEAGEKLAAMLALGASKPWPDALEELTGKRRMDGAALIEYFNPLMKYLQEQNKGRTCGF